jgi:hypothetical protein
MVFLNIGSSELFARGWLQTTNPPDLCLLNSWDYRHELPPALGAQQDRVFKKIIKVK